VFSKPNLAQQVKPQVLPCLDKLSLVYITDLNNADFSRFLCFVVGCTLCYSGKNRTTPVLVLWRIIGLLSTKSISARKLWWHNAWWGKV